MCGKLRGMPQENGKLSLSTLTRLSVGGYLTTAAANSFERLRLAGARDGVNVTITSTADAYREYAIQERIFTERYIPTYTEYAPGKVDKRYWQGRYWFRRRGTAAAAVPGTSNHGWAIAIDIANVGGFNSTFYRWLSNNAPALGWSNDEGRSVGEAWHWTYKSGSDGGGGTAPSPTPTPEEEDDMLTAAEVANAVLNTPDPALGGKTVHQVLAGLAPVRADVATVHASVLATQDLFTPGKTGVKFDGDIYKRITGTQADIATVHASVLATPQATASTILNTKVKRAGSATGETSLAAVLAWYDDHILRLLGDQVTAGGSIDMAQVTAAIKTAADAALADIEITLAPKTEASK